MDTDTDTSALNTFGTFHPDDEKNGISKPPKKKGRPMKLGLKLENDIRFDQSYKVTDNGTFSKDGFKINSRGMVTPSDGNMRDDSESPRSQISITSDDLYDMGTLGKGASGMVKKMLHIPTMQMIALKSIDVFEKATRHQLIQELSAFAGSENPHVVSFLGAYFENGNTKLALEFLNRGSLEDVLNTSGPFPEDVLASIAKQSLLGLAHLHSVHKVHRDIKPANILVNVHGHVKLADFGILAELANTQAKCNTFIGTTAYMSPERIKGEEYSFASDVWSLGLSLMTCALGKLPLDSSGGYWGLVEEIGERPITPLPASFSGTCRSFVASCLHKNPSRRIRVKDLLKHPFVSKVDVTRPVSWPFQQCGGDAELADLEVMLRVMKDRLYPHGKEDYKQSIFELARFQRIGSQLGFAPAAIQQKFERMLLDDGDDDDDEH